MLYLRAQFLGEATNLAQGLPITDASYDEAIDLLKEPIHSVKSPTTPPPVTTRGDCGRASIFRAAYEEHI